MVLRDLLVGATEDDLQAFGEALAPYAYASLNARIQGDVRDDRKIRITAAGVDVKSTAAGAQVKYTGESYADHLNFLGLSVKVNSSITGRRYDIGGGGMMNADYVVDASGGGTHLTLYGATGALQAAIATGLSAFIWLCTTHTETLSAQEVLPALAAGQQIIIASGTRERAVITVAIASTTLAMTIPNANGAGSSLSFKSFRFTRTTGTGALIGPAAGGPTIVPLEFENMDFKNGGSTFDALVGGSLLAAMTTSTLVVRGCTGDGVLVIQQLSATSSSLGAFTMEDCTMTLEGVNRQSSDTSVDWGTSAGGVSIRNNILTVTTKLYKQNYDMAYFHIDNNVFIHSSANIFIRTGVVQTGSNIHICDNSYTGATVGCKFLSLESATSNIHNCNVTGNNLKGPGSGTAIATILVNTGGLPDSLNFIGNTYRDWTTNFNGVAGGATDDVLNPDSTGGFVVSTAPTLVVGGAGPPTTGSIFEIISPQGAGAGLTLLLPRFPTTARPGSPTSGMLYYDSTLGRFVGYENGAWATLVTNEGEGLRYPLLLGRSSGNIFTGYASWGTDVGATGYSTAVQAIAGLQAYWRCGEASGNLADTTVNANTMTLVGAATYSQTGAISGDSNKAVKLDGANANYFSNAGSASLDVDDVFSIVAWVKKGEDGRIQSILTCTTNGFLFQIDASNKLTLGKAGVAYILQSTTTITNDGLYHMVAVTKTGATVKLYIDAVDVTGAISNLTIATGAGGEVDIGRTVGFNGQGWNGTLDEIALWNVAISAANVTTLYSAGIGGAPAPANTTDGDITGLRLNIGNVAQTSGVEAQITGDGTFSGYLRIGSNAAPSNTTAGDVSGKRLMIGTDAVFGSASNSVLFNFPSVTPIAGMTPFFLTGTYTPAGANNSVNQIQNTLNLAPTAADAGGYGLFVSQYNHTVGAFNQTGSATLIDMQINKTVGGTTLEIIGYRALMVFSAGTLSNLEVFRSHLLTAGGTVTNFTHYDIVHTNILSTTVKGLNIPNLGGSNTTNSIAIDIAAQSASATLNVGIRNASMYWAGVIAVPATPSANFISMFGFAKATGAYQDTPRFLDSAAHDSGSVMRAHNAIPMPVDPFTGTLTSVIPSASLGIIGMVHLLEPITVHTISYNIGTVAAGVNGVIRLAVYTESGALIINTTDSPGLVTGVQTKTLGADVYLPAGLYKVFFCMSVNETVTNPAISCMVTEGTFRAVTSEDILCGTVVVTAGAAPDPHGTITSIATPRTPYFKFGGAAT